MGRLAASFELRANVGDATRAPGQVLRAPAEDSGREGAWPLSHLLRPPRRDPVVALLGTLSRVGSDRTAPAAVLLPRRPLPSRCSRWTARVHRDLEGPRLSARFLPALRCPPVTRAPGGRLLRTRAHAARAR